jgi:hypothetical protein
MSASEPGKGPAENPDAGAQSAEAAGTDDPARQAGSTYDFAADLKLRDEADDPLDPQGAQAEGDRHILSQPLITQPYDFAADLVLHEDVEDELLDAVQSPVMMAPVSEGVPREHDFAADLRLQESEEATTPELITRSVIPTLESSPTEAPVMIEQPSAEVSDEEFWVELPGPGQNLESLSAPRGVHHAERDDYKDAACTPQDAHAAVDSAISQQVAAALEMTDRKKSALSRRKRGFQNRPAGRLAWVCQLETWLVLASLSLVLQIFPTLFWRLTAFVDARNWTWGMWVGMEIAVIAVLLLLRVRQTADA